MENKEMPHFRKDNGYLMERNMKNCLLSSLSIVSLQSPFHSIF